MGLQGDPGAPGAPGAPGPSTVTLETDTCQTVNQGSFSCTVTCSGVGAIAMASGGWETAATGYIMLNSQSQVLADPSSWTFTFGTEGVEVDVPVTMSVVCFTPPT